ncbi:alkaline phosphatase family protein [Phycisphaera mikurensis]|uniref:Alkaline phosphatase family protein n=1 Tax=Phycisphaera mikurensis (strain NBRC 102666 / KCTC 22515 / FYK2301M01) TaxID=1142394 RepID=I0IG91_PHYMF|nr:nucleotide pyrophosphatase/phosphodiesterase family protein [Phycisphaera mikurensis]MBB6440339.1 hypothetical protein [Phycisphaera mikurensis]BAM04279.1 hypothetical protein PSMK_21200 [Phycisphaera mikurensis NBRC 102666]
MPDPPQPVALLEVVGLSGSLLRHAPRLRAFAERAGQRELQPVFPAVTCSVQSTMLTGRPVGGPEGHGVVGNGWFDRRLAEIHFWKQSNRLVRGPSAWEEKTGHGPRGAVSCANLFWWFNMATTAGVAVTPRPQYRADGRKVPDVWTKPPGLRDELQRELGRFPLFRFWGPGSDITSTRWIAEATKRVVDRHDPTLTLAYLPHLDYVLQREGPGGTSVPAEVAAVDAVAGDLLDHLEERGRRVLVVSGYGVRAVDTPLYPNRILRDAGLLAVREEGGREVIDLHNSRAFAVCDHQVAHVYHQPGLELPAFPRTSPHPIDAEHAGDTVLEADEGCWFSYDFWPEGRDDLAPDYARTVAIHAKPGYDPRELFLGLSKPTLAWKILKRKLGFAQPLDVIPLDATLVKGCHGRAVAGEQGPVLLGAGDGPRLALERVRGLLLH